MPRIADRFGTRVAEISVPRLFRFSNAFENVAPSTAKGFSKATSSTARCCAASNAGRFCATGVTAMTEAPVIATDAMSNLFFRGVDVDDADQKSRPEATGTASDTVLLD